MTTTLTDEQKQKITGWIEAGAGLSEVQKRIKSEFDVSMTFIDVRFLVINLGLKLKDKAAEAKKVEAERRAKEQAESELDESDADERGSVSVEMDRIVKPGFLISGTVTFSDRTRATWGLDQMGRLALDAASPGYRPSPEDVKEFQIQLQQLLSRRGFQ